MCVMHRKVKKREELHSGLEIMLILNSNKIRLIGKNFK